MNYRRFPPQKWAGTLELLDKSIVEMRRMSHNLMPEALTRFGLRPVLEEFCAVAPGVHFYFFGDERRFEADIETHFYRIACELINNAIKHSKAHQINVQLLSSTDKISLTVQDDGCGFDTSDVHEGLTTVRSRVSLLGAKLYIFSAKENGTEITVELDLKYEQV